MPHSADGALRDATAGALTLLERLAGISSPSDDPAGLSAIAGALADEFTKRGLVCEILRRPSGALELPVVVARGGAASERPLVVIGHMDTVLDAAPVRRAGERLFATGAIDMKGGLAAFLGALDLARLRGTPVPDDLLVVVVPDEEVAGPIARAAPREWADSARAFWVIEPGEPTAEGETIVAGRRGLFDWRLDARGRAAHSGLHYWEGRSAVAAAAAWSAAASALSQRDSGPTVNIARFVGGDEAFVDDLGRGQSLLGTARQLNVVPDRAIVEGEARFLRAEEGDVLARRLTELTTEISAATSCALSFARDETVPPVDPRGPHAEWIGRAVQCAARRGWRLEVERERGGVSFPNFLPDPSRLPVLDGLGPVGGGMHTRDEHVFVTSIGRRVALLADLLEAAAS